MAQVEVEENVLAVRNISKISQHVYWEDRRETIYPEQVRSLPVALAREFLATRAKFCVLYRPVQMPSMAGMSTVWVANTTGNPWTPETVMVRRKYRGEMIEEAKPHPLRVPFVVCEMISRGQTVQPAREGDGDESLNHPKMRVEIPPYERLPVPVAIAEVMVERDQQRTDGWAGQVEHCRPPSEFEPNETWPYDEIRLYAALMAPDLYAPLLDAPKGEVAKFPVEAAWGANKNALREAKTRLLNMLFFQIIDEERPYVDPREFKSKLALLKEAAHEAGKRAGATAPRV